MPSFEQQPRFPQEPDSEHSPQSSPAAPEHSFSDPTRGDASEKPPIQEVWLDQVSQDAHEVASSTQKGAEAVAQAVSHEGAAEAYAMAKQAKAEAREWLAQMPDGVLNLHHDSDRLQVIARRLELTPEALAATLDLFRKAGTAEAKVGAWMEATYVSRRLNQLMKARESESASTASVVERREEEQDPARIIRDRLQTAQSQLEHAGFPDDAREVAQAIKRVEHARAIGEQQVLLWCKRWPKRPEIDLKPIEKIAVRILEWWEGPPKPPPTGGAIVRRDGDIEHFNDPGQFKDHVEEPPLEIGGYDDEADYDKRRPGPGDAVVSWMPQGKAREIIERALQPEYRRDQSGRVRNLALQGLPDSELLISESQQVTDWAWSQRFDRCMYGSLAMIELKAQNSDAAT